MKKIMAAALVSLSLLVGASAYAASSNLVGQKVQGLFAVKKDGIKIADAVIINGVAYAPVRAVSEAVGINLSVSGKEIIMENSIKDVPVDNATSQSTTVPNTDSVDASSDRESILIAIEKKKEQIANFKQFEINTWESLIKENPNSTTIPKWQTALDAANVQLQQLERELNDLQNQL